MKKRKKKVKKDEFAVELVEKFDDEDLCDDCLVCQAEKFRNKYDKYPSPQELTEFLKRKKFNQIINHSGIPQNTRIK